MERKEYGLMAVGSDLSGQRGLLRVLAWRFAGALPPFPFVFVERVLSG